jgi:hypothetical protein
MRFHFETGATSDRWRLALGVMCLIVVVVILVAGLWPFNPFPKNQVSWDPNGLRFGDYGWILSSTSFPVTAGRGQSCALELWMEPGLTEDSNIVLAFSVPKNPLQFRIAQEEEGVFVARDFFGPGAQLRTQSIGLGHIVHQGKSILITVTTSSGGAAVYVDGNLLKDDRGFRLAPNDFTGTMVLANSPVENNSWMGVLKGIAIYGSSLAPKEVTQHYQAWSKGDPSLLATQGAQTLYLFREGSGQIVHNAGLVKGPDLSIPNHYVILQPQFLMPFWKALSFNRSFFKNVALNILAFVPVGFLFNTFFFTTRFKQRSPWIAIALGAALSLTIEVLQYFLPMRDSGMLDLITNTLGTAIGVWGASFAARRFGKVIFSSEVRAERPSFPCAPLKPALEPGNAGTNYLKMSSEERKEQ